MSKTRRIPFLAGETVIIRAVGSKDFEQWAEWFSDSRVTKFLDQGIFPIGALDQERWYRDQVEKGRFLGMVEEREGGKLLGVCSISAINWQHKSGQVSVVCPGKSSESDFPGLEARALLTQHAINTMNLDRLWAGQAYPGNLRWTTAQAILGWLPEGLRLNSFLSGPIVSDVVTTSALRQTVLELIEKRNGSLWPGQVAVRKLLLSDDLKDVENQIEWLAESLGSFRKSFVAKLLEL